MPYTATDPLPVVETNGTALQESAERRAVKTRERRGRSWWARGTAKRRWLISAGIVIAVAAALFSLLGMAALVPLLYLAPLGICLVMCTRGSKCSKKSGTESR